MKILKHSATNFKSFSRSLEQFFLTVGQNNFGNKIPFWNLTKIKDLFSLSHYFFDILWLGSKVIFLFIVSYFCRINLDQLGSQENWLRHHTEREALEHQCQFTNTAELYARPKTIFRSVARPTVYIYTTIEFLICSNIKKRAYEYFIWLVVQSGKLTSMCK